MNIQDKIRELDALIEERTVVERALWNESTVKEDEYKKSTRAWADVHDVIRLAKDKRSALIELQKDCEVVISRGVPVTDEDIGRTVPLPPEVKGLGGVMYPGIKAIIHRIPVFRDGQENEFLK